MPFLTISINIIIFLKAQISSQKWPSDGLWPVFIDQMNITYNSTFFDATIYNTMLVDGSDATHGSMLEVAEQLRDYVENNFIKVSCRMHFIGLLKIHCNYKDYNIPFFGQFCYNFYWYFR